MTAVRSAWELVVEDHDYPHGWERTERLPVPGGWLYRTTVARIGHNLLSVALTFVPDPTVNRSVVKEST